ncbi:MAG: hypothetical protein ACTSPI_00315 [Candidatus Heimdallarchaeaceae archaeon]
MADYFLSDLVESTALVNTDLLHIRTIGNVDKKVQFLNLVKTFRDILNKNANYTILDTDRNPIILVDSTSGDITITLPTLATNQNKMIWIVKLVAANNVIIDGEGGETINGVASYTLVNQYEVLKIIGTTSTWNIDGKGNIRAADIDFGVAAGDVDADVLPLGTAVTSSPTGGTSTNLANSSFVRAAIQEVFNRLKDLSGVQNGAVVNRHIGNNAVREQELDLGVNAGDVDADVLPLGTAVTSSPTGGTSTNLANTSFVRAALQTIFNRLINLSGVQNNAVLDRHIGNDQLDSRHYKTNSIDEEHINWGTGSGQIGLFKSHMALILTNWDNNAQPQIAANGSCEINGQLYTNPSAITISGSTSNSTWYDILLTPSGTTYTASFITRGTGVWSDSKQGLYSGNNRVIGCVYRNSSGGFINKNILIVKDRITQVSIEIGDWNMDLTDWINVAHGITVGDIRTVSVLIRHDLGTFIYPLDVYSSGQSQGGINSISNTDITLMRGTGGLFDDTIFDSTSYNRGWVIIEYKV